MLGNVDDVLETDSIKGILLSCSTRAERWKGAENLEATQRELNYCLDVKPQCWHPKL